VAGKPAEDKEHNDDMSSITGNEGRVMRGGSFGNQALVGRSAYRNKLVPTNRISTIGFRPARTLPPGSFPALPPAAEDGRK
jgi:formylglycine-generating enzyme required for sulfatase activity